MKNMNFSQSEYLKALSELQKDYYNKIFKISKNNIPEIKEVIFFIKSNIFP